MHCGRDVEATGADEVGVVVDVVDTTIVSADVVGVARFPLPAHPVNASTPANTADAATVGRVVTASTVSACSAVHQ